MRAKGAILKPSLPGGGLGILGNNRRRRDIEAAHAIFKRRGCTVDLQPQSVVDPPCGATCCPLCGKVEQNPLWVRSALAAVFVSLRGPSLAIGGYRRGLITAPNLLAPVQSCFSGKRMNQAIKLGIAKRMFMRNRMALVRRRSCAERRRHP